MRASIGAVLLLGALVALPLGAGGALAQAPHDDPMTMSSNQVIGSPVYNERNQRIGTLEDALVRPSGESRLVLSVGDFVGHGKMVAVPMSRVVMRDGRLTMTGATKAALEAMPKFSYQAGDRSG
jgi:sporulation protein YlmC with PRC-barrel domain